jgi:hypothetical protein
MGKGKGFGGLEKRRARRVAHHYVIKFRQIEPPAFSEQWDTSTVRNISKTGISFFSSHHYTPGSKLEIKLRNPLSQEDNRCWATVLRSHSSGQRADSHDVAVQIDKVEGPRAPFDKTIDFFIKKESTGKQKRQTGKGSNNKKENSRK